MIKKLNQPEEPKYVRPNDEWYNVPVAIAEDDTEAVIQVQRLSIRRMRKQFTWAVTAFVVGSLLIIFQSPQRNNFLAPGPLSSNHAQLLNGMGADRCNACHDVGNQSFLQWAVASLQPGRNVQACQSQLCMKCHQNTMDPELALKPHNVEPELLAGKNKLQFVSTTDNDESAPDLDDIECSTCHKEHHGQRGLTFLTDQQCQTCHQQQFDSFEHGHPEFSKWPQSRRQSIAFDHTSHGFKHFPAANAEFDCKMCHLDDSYSNVKTLASYEQSCAQCHEQDIDLRSQPGLQIVELPMLDLDAIQQHGLSIGTWPENAAGDFDGKIPELMQLLLSCDRDFTEVMSRRGGKFDFSDMDPESASDVSDAVDIAWSIKKLIGELADGGNKALSEKFAAALDLSSDDQRIYMLTRGLDANVFANAANRWLPGMSEEMPKQVTAVTSETAPSNVVQELASTDENHFILPYISNSLRQDDDTLIANPLQDLMKDQSQGDFLPVPMSESSQARVNDKPNIESELVKTSEAGNANATVEPGNQPPNKTTAPSSTHSNVAQLPIENRPRALPESTDDKELLAPNPLAGMSNSSRPTFEPQREADRPRIESDELQIAKEFSNEIEKTKQLQHELNEPGQPDNVGRFEPDHRGEIFVGGSRTSGWFRNDQLFQISYRPSGHADNFLATVMDVVAGQTDAANNIATSAIFEKMVSDSSIGACNDCHTIDAETDGMRVNWVASYRDPSLRSFTHFSHGPHLIQSELADCTACHQINAELTNAHTFEHFDSSEVISNFEPIRKSNCVSCHHETGAGNSCTQCHDYHVGAKILMGN